MPMEVRVKPQPRFSLKRVWRFFGIPLLVIGIVVGFVRGGYTLREWQGQRKLSQAIVDLEQSGIATKPAATEVAYRAITSDVDTQAWLDLFEQLESVEFIEAAKGVPNFDASVATDEWEDSFDTSKRWKYAQVSMQFVDRQRDLIHRIRELAAAPQPVRFPIRFEAMNTLLPEVQSCRGLARLVWLDAQVALYLGDSQRAYENFVTLHHLVRHVEAVPFSLCFLVSKSYKNMALSIVQKGVEQDLFGDQQLKDIDVILAGNCDIGDEWREGCERDLGMFVPAFLDPAIAVEKETKPLPARGNDGVYYIDLMTKLAEIPTDDWGVFYNRVSQQELEFEEDIRSWRGRIDLILTGVVAPTMKSLAEVSIDRAQHYRQARHGVALRLFLHKHGKFPVSLAELPPFDRDMRAFKQQPFGYSLTPNGAVLWGGRFEGKSQQILSTIPLTDQQTSDSFENRRYVWNLEPGQQE
jgi:hypothetical protein